MDFIYSSAKSA